MKRLAKSVHRWVGAALSLGCVVIAAPATGWPSPQAMIELSDAELSLAVGGVFETQLGEFNVTIQDNDAGSFTLDIAQSAFQNAQGVFTTLQTVNSAIDLTVVVNIFLNSAGSSGNSF
jgi:hypothetical protein